MIEKDSMKRSCERLRYGFLAALSLLKGVECRPNSHFAEEVENLQKEYDNIINFMEATDGR